LFCLFAVGVLDKFTSFFLVSSLFQRTTMTSNKCIGPRRARKKRTRAASQNC